MHITDVGIRNDLGSHRFGEIIWALSIESRSGFRGSVEVRDRRDDERLRSSHLGDTIIAREVTVPPGSTREVCLSAKNLWGEQQDILARDEEGHVRASMSFSRRKWSLDMGENRIAILSGDPNDIQAVQNAILFPSGEGGDRTFEQPSVKFLYLGDDCPSCWQQLMVLSYLIVARSVQDLLPEQREAIRLATLKGLRVLVIDSFAGNEAFLATVPTGRVTRLGEGCVLHARDLTDGEALASIRLVEARSSRRAP